jgi:imidazolonepropionase-like amidohydrolase
VAKETMFTLIENGDVYGPEPLGRDSVLLSGNTILKIGEVDTSALEKLGLPVEVIDASGCIVTPGFIDPHQHLLGGSGEEGFSSQTPEVSASEITGARREVTGAKGSDRWRKASISSRVVEFQRELSSKQQSRNRLGWRSRRRMKPEAEE